MGNGGTYDIYYYFLLIYKMFSPETNDKRFENCMHIKVEDDKSADIATNFKSAIEFITAMIITLSH